MKFPSVKNLLLGITGVIERFPFEVLFALCGTVSAIALAERQTFDSTNSNWYLRVMMTANLGLLISLSLTLFLEGKGIQGAKKAVTKLFAAVAACLLIFLINPLEREFDTVRFLLLSVALHLFVAFAAFTSKGQVQGFWQFNKALFLRFLAGVLYSIVLYLGLFTAIEATRLLFNIHWDRNIYADLWACIAGLFNTLFFLAGVPKNLSLLSEDGTYPKGLKIFTQYVLIPLATIYVTILLAYEVKIIAQWSLPKGMVSNLILGYAVFGILSILLVYPVRGQEGNKWIKTYSRSFYFLLIPLIILLFLALAVRIIPYGITPQRYFLMALACWLLFISIYFLLSTKQNIKLIPVSLFVLTLLTVYGPQSSFSVSLSSQVHILTAIFKKYDSFKGGKLLSVMSTKINVKDGSDAAAKLSFLINQDGLIELQPYINKDLKKVIDSLRKQRKKKNGNFYDSKYVVHSDQLEWAKNYLGLRRFSEFGGYSSDTSNNISFHFFTNTDEALIVKNYDYLINITSNNDNVPDTSVLHGEHIRFVSLVDKGVYSLSLNNEVVSFMVRDFAEKLIKQKEKFKSYMVNDTDTPPVNNAFMLPDSLMSITKETLHYKIAFKIGGLRTGNWKSEKPSIYDVNGHYLIKVK